MREKSKGNRNNKKGMVKNYNMQSYENASNQVWKYVAEKWKALK